MKLLITGASGFVGQHVLSELKQHLDSDEILSPPSFELDLMNLNEVINYINKQNVDHIIHLAAVVGGIGANKRQPADFFYKNLMMGVNTMYAASTCVDFSKFINVGTICSYPKFAQTPFIEENLWNGFPEETNAPYGIAKRAVLMYGNALSSQYGMNVVNLLPVNMGGPGDNFNPMFSHVIPSIILKIDKAIDANKNKVSLWGAGEATREFIHVADTARAIYMTLINKDPLSKPINIGTGKDMSIKSLANKISDSMSYGGDIIFTGQVSDGQPRRRLDISRAINQLNFTAEKTLDDIIKDEVEWYYSLKKNYPDLINGWRMKI